MTGSRDFDWITLLTAVILCIVGVSMIYSVFQPTETGGNVVDADYFYFKRQMLWMVFAMVAMFVGIALPFRVYETLAPILYALCIILLIAVLVLPGSTGTERWLVLGPIRLQPSEFTKIAVLFLWARLLSGHRGDPKHFKSVMSVLAVFLIPFLLVLKQPDLGTAVVFFALLLPVLYWRGVKGIHILYILTPLVTAFLVVYGDYQHELSGSAASGEGGGSAWPIGVFLVFIFVVAYLRRSHIAESVALVVANLGVALVTPLLWGDLKPYQQKRIIFGFGLAGDPVEDRHRVGRPGGQGVSGGHAKSSGVLAGQAYRLYFFSAGRGTRVRGSGGRAILVRRVDRAGSWDRSKVQEPVCEHGVRGNSVVLFSAGAGERGDDDGDGAGDGNTAAVHQLRRQFTGGELLPDRVSAELLGALVRVLELSGVDLGGGFRRRGFE